MKYKEGDSLVLPKKCICAQSEELNTNLIYLFVMKYYMRIYRGYKSNDRSEGEAE